MRGVLRDEENGRRIEDALQRAHKLVIFTSEAITVAVHNQIESDGSVSLPLGNETAMCAIFRSILDMRQTRRGAKDRVRVNSPYREHVVCVRQAFLRVHGDEERIDGRALSRIVTDEARRYVKDIKTSMKNTYRRRVRDYCRIQMALPDAEYNALDRDGRKRHNARVDRVATQICRPGWADLDLPVDDEHAEEDAAFIQVTREALGLESIQWISNNRKRTLRGTLTRNPEYFLPGLALINHCRHAAGQRISRLLPLRTTLTPRFIMLHKEAMMEMNIIGDDLKRQLRAEAEVRQDEVRPYDTRLKEMKKRHAMEKREWSQADLDGQPSDQERARRDARKTAMENEVQVLESDQEYVRLREGLARENQMALDAIFDVSELSGTKQERLCWTVLSDGVSMRLFAEPIGDAPRRRRDGSRLLPRRGEMDIEHLREALGVEEMRTDELARVANEINNLSPKEQNQRLNSLLGFTGSVRILGADPGVHELLVVSDPDKGTNQRYTAKQRRSAMRQGSYFLKNKHNADEDRRRLRDQAREYRSNEMRKPAAVLDAERSLSDHNSNGPSLEDQLAYFRARSTGLQTLLDWYRRREHRQQRWKQFRDQQRSFADLCARIRTMGPGQQRAGNGVHAQVVIAYGAWALNSSMKFRGLPPCVGKGLLEKLMQEFPIITVPEYRTSKCCYHCGGRCVNHVKLANKQRRAKRDEGLRQKYDERMARAQTDDERAAVEQWYARALARPCQIRGLRLCKRCGRCLNRDRNAAQQMAVQLKRLLLGLGMLHRFPPEDEPHLNRQIAIEEGGA